MKSDECVLRGMRSDINTALEEVEKVAAYNDLSHKEALQLRLLAEEMMGMQAEIMGFAKGKFYLENRGKTYNIYLHTKIDSALHREAREKLVEMSTSKRNAAYTGFMGRIRKMIDNMLDSSEAAYYTTSEQYYGASMVFTYPVIDYERVWELSSYRKEAREKMDQWDELEKSIVASICDELVVGARNDYVDMIAVKTFD